MSQIVRCIVMVLSLLVSTYLNYNMTDSEKQTLEALLTATVLGISGLWLFIKKIKESKGQ